MEGLWGILPKEGRPGDNTRIRMLVNESLEISQINTANKSVESSRVPNRKDGRKNSTESLLIREYILARKILDVSHVSHLKKFPGKLVGSF